MIKQSRWYASTVLILVAGLVTALLVWPPTNGTAPPTSPPHTLRAVAPIPPTSCQFNGIQTINATGAPTGGTWNLSLDGGSTTTPTYNVAGSAPSAGTLQTDIQALAGVPSGDVVVSGSYPTYTVTFSGTIYNTVNLFTVTIVSALTGGTTPKIKAHVVPQDQTPQFSQLINSTPDNTTITLPHDSCWEIDSHFPAGGIAADLYINDPNGTAQPSTALINGGTLTSALGKGGTLDSPGLTNGVSTGTSIPMQGGNGSGTVDIPMGSNVRITQGGHTQTFVTTSDTPPNSSSIAITSQTANFSYVAGTATVALEVTSLAVTSTGAASIPDGTAVALTAPLGTVQSFTVSNGGSPIAPGSTSVPIATTVSIANFTVGSPFAGYYTSIPFSPSNATDVPNGTELYMDGPGNHFQLFTTNADTPPGSTAFPVTGAPANFAYPTSSNIFPIPQISSVDFDGTSRWDVPSGSTVTVTASGCATSFCSDFFHTTMDAPAGYSGPVTILPKVPSYPLDTNSSVYDTGNFLHIHGSTGLTINGNGASLVQTACQPSEITGGAPILFLTQDTGLTIKDLTLTGAIGWPGASCNDNGPAFEKSAGIYAESETNLTITDIGVFNVQGDGVSLQAPVDFGNTTKVLDTNVVVSNSTFDGGGGGYHGLVVEGVGPTAACTAALGVGTPTNPTCGAKFSGDYWIHWPTEMMDFEVDAGGTIFNTGTGCNSLPGGLCPTAFAQDNISFTNSHYESWCSPWFTSANVPNLQEQNLSFTGNLLVNNFCHSGGTTAGFMGVGGADPLSENPQFWSANWVVENNVETGSGFSSTTGGGCVPVSGSATVLQDVVGVTITHNTFPVAYNLGCTNPHIQFLFLANDHNVTVGDNDFTGAYRVAPPPAPTTESYVQCGNNWGVAGTATPPASDSPC
jgi:hypothetical protein